MTKDQFADALDVAWGVIATVGGSDWSKQSPEWQETAARWRDNYYRVYLASLSGSQGQWQDRCPLVEDGEASNPFVADCGAKFDTMEEAWAHNAKHKSAPPPPADPTTGR